MIFCNLSVLLAERRKKISMVSFETGISRTTLTALSNNNFKGIQTETLNTLCNYLNVTVNDIISHFPLDINKVRIDIGTFDEVDCSSIVGNMLLSIKHENKPYTLELKFSCCRDCGEDFSSEYHIYEVNITELISGDDYIIEILKNAPHIVIKSVEDIITKEIDSKFASATDIDKKIVIDSSYNWTIFKK